MSGVGQEGQQLEAKSHDALGCHLESKLWEPAQLVQIYQHI